jgi:hypothetical protein
MNKKTSIVSFGLAIALVISLLTPALPVQAQQPSYRNWDAVQSLPADAKLEIKLKTGKSVRGKFERASDSDLSIARKGKTETYSRDQILQIYHSIRKAEKGKYAAIGAGIGAGTGLAIGLAKNSPPVDDGEIYPTVGSILGAGIGAVGGLLFGQAKRKKVLIYQA